MRVRVRLGEPFWRAVGQRDLEVNLPQGSTLADLLTHLRRAYPALDAELAEAPPMLFLGEQEAAPDALLHDRDQVHLLWPVAGGSGPPLP